jgi:hypothetical protein
MRAIVNDPGSVVYRRNWGKDPDEVRYRPDGGFGKTVTGVYNQLDAAGLVKRGPALHASMYAPQIIEATAAGRQWLADHDKERA